MTTPGSASASALTAVPSTDKEVPAPEYDDMFDTEDGCSILKWNTLKDLEERRTEKCWFYVRRRAGVRKLKAKVMKTMRNQHVSDKTNWKPRLVEFILDPRDWSKSSLSILKYEKCGHTKQFLNLAHLVSVEKAALRFGEALSFPIKTVSGPSMRLAKNNYAPEAEQSSDSDDDFEMFGRGGDAAAPSPSHSDRGPSAMGSLRSAPPHRPNAAEVEFRHGHIILAIREASRGVAGVRGDLFGELCCGSTRVRDAWVRLLQDFMVMYEMSTIRRIDQPLFADENERGDEGKAKGGKLPSPRKQVIAGRPRQELSDGDIRSYVKFFNRQHRGNKGKGSGGKARGTPGLNADPRRPPSQQGNVLAIRFPNAPEAEPQRRNVVVDPKRPGWVLLRSKGIVNTAKTTAINLLDYSIRKGVHNLKTLYFHELKKGGKCVTIEVGEKGENVKLRDDWADWFVAVKAHAAAHQALHQKKWVPVQNLVTQSECYLEQVDNGATPRVAFKTWPAATWQKESCESNVTPGYYRMEGMPGKRAVAARVAKGQGCAEEVAVDVVYDLFEVFAQTKEETTRVDRSVQAKRATQSPHSALRPGAAEVPLAPSPSGFLGSPYGSPFARDRFMSKASLKPSNLFKVDYSHEQDTRAPLLPAPWEVFEEIPYAREHRFSDAKELVEFKAFFGNGSGTMYDWWGLDPVMSRKKRAAGKTLPPSKAPPSHSRAVAMPTAKTPLAPVGSISFETEEDTKPAVVPLAAPTPNSFGQELLESSQPELDAAGGAAGSDTDSDDKLSAAERKELIFGSSKEDLRPCPLTLASPCQQPSDAPASTVSPTFRTSPARPRLAGLSTSFPTPLAAPPPLLRTPSPVRRASAPLKCWGKLSTVGGAAGRKVLVVGFLDGESRQGISIPVAKMTSVKKDGDVAFAVSQGDGSRQVFAAPTEELRDRWVEVLLKANLALLPAALRPPASPTRDTSVQVDFERGTLLWKLPEGRATSMSPPQLPPGLGSQPVSPLGTGSAGKPPATSPLLSLNARPKGGPSIHDLIHNINVVSGFPGTPTDASKRFDAEMSQRSNGSMQTLLAPSGAGKPLCGRRSPVSLVHPLSRTPRASMSPASKSLLACTTSRSRSASGPYQSLLFAPENARPNILLGSPVHPTASRVGTPATTVDAGSPFALPKMTFDEARDLLAAAQPRTPSGPGGMDLSRKALAWL